MSQNQEEVLIEEGLRLTVKIAWRISADLSLPYRIEPEDLAQDGAIGLIKAARSFDKERGVEFGAFAHDLIKYAIIDRLRRETWPRNLRRLRRKFESAREKLRSSLGREPSLEDLKTHLGYKKLEQFKYVFFRIATVEACSPYLSRCETKNAFVPAGFIPPEPLSPEVLFEKSQWRRRLLKAISELPPRDRKVIRLYYFAELTNKEVGTLLGVSFPRVSQIRTKAIRRLRAFLS